MKKLLLCFIIFSKSNFVLAQSCNVIDEFNPLLANTLTEAEYNSFPWTTDSTFLDNYYNTLVQQFGNPAASTLILALKFFDFADQILPTNRINSDS